MLLYYADIPVGEKGKDDDGRSPKRSPVRSGLTDRDTRDFEEERWFDRDYDDDRDRDGDEGHRRCRGGGEGGRGTVHSRFEDKDITDLKMVIYIFLFLFVTAVFVI